MNKLLALLLLGLLCLPITQLQFTSASSVISSTFANYQPTVDGTVSENEWSSAVGVTLQHGKLMFQNDAANLYLLVDLTGDTQNDPPLNTTPWGDYFSLAFDVNTDSLMTAGVDVLYGLYRGTHNLCKQYYTGSGWSGVLPTASLLGAGFGSSLNNATAHRIWEIAVSLPEIEAVPGSMVRLGLKVYSQNPSFTEEKPTGFLSSFASLVEITLASKTVDLLVLADEGFCGALKPLKAHKDYTGICTYIQSWQSLNKSFTEEGRDEPERIKKAIATYDRYCSARWVMLVGDCDRFPVRYTITDRNTTEAYNRAFYASDLYYACLYEPGGGYIFDDWDYNQDGYFGELHGETIIGEVNIDRVDPNPDIAVGRVPASTVAEVTNYVNKVITYEFSAYKADWLKKALMVATIDWLQDACLTKENITSNYLTGYQITRLYSPGNPYGTTPTPNASSINNALNSGVAFANYIGHGSEFGWAIPSGGYSIADTAGLSNSGKLPIAFGVACGTSKYTTEPPYEPYSDVLGVHHSGTNVGEVFTNIPPAPASIQTIDNPSCFGEYVIVNNSNCFIGYIGCATGAQSWGRDLDTFFFQSLSYGWDTLGEMWRYAVLKYYQLHPIPSSLGQPDWFTVAMVHQPWKFHLFGDPSLRIRGVSTIQKQDFVGAYKMVHDGWEGTLTLRAAADNYVEAAPNLIGTYTSSDGHRHDVRGYVRTWEYPLSESWGPDHKIEFYIDFPDTPQTSDDQKFEGYLFTQTKLAMAGTTWWNNIPFGFYATKILGIFIPLNFYINAGGTYHCIGTLSNSTVSNVLFSETTRKISLYVSGPVGTYGACNVTIPATLLWGTFSLYLDGNILTEDVNYTKFYNTTHNTFLINYAHSAHIIEIVATEAIPEFTSWLLLPVFTLATLLLAKIYRAKNKQSKTA